MFVLLSGRRGSDKVGNALSKVTMIFSTVPVDRLLDILSLLRCALSAYHHMMWRCKGCRTVVEAGEADLESKERRKTVLLL